MLSSAIQVSYPAQGEMVVEFPRQVLGPALLLLVGFVLAIFAVGLIRSTGFKWVSLLYALGLLPLLVAVYLMTSRSTLSFSRGSNSLVVTNEAFFMSRQHTYDLKAIDHVEVAQDDGSSHVFYLAMASQDRIAVGGGWTPRSGYFQAANAVNSFLTQTRLKEAGTPSGERPDASMPSMEELGRRAIAKELAARKQAQP